MSKYMTLIAVTIKQIGTPIVKNIVGFSREIPLSNGCSTHPPLKMSSLFNFSFVLMNSFMMIPPMILWFFNSYKPQAYLLLIIDRIFLSL